MYAITAAEFTLGARLTFSPTGMYIALCRFPRSILSNTSLQFCSKLSHAVYQLLGVRKVVTSSYHPRGNGGVERVNPTMVLMLTMVVNELPNNWDEQLPDIEFCVQQFRQRRHGFGSQRGP